MKQITKILHENDLVRTGCRQEIVQAILNSPTPLSEEEIKVSISGNFDRTTFYRTFKILMAKGVIHKIVIDNTLVKYAITEKQNKTKQHAHFYCLNCGRVFCVPKVNWEYTGLPESFKAEQAELLIKGYCTKCN
jgi:Fur family transcriptional regulator, ferric uptake regulator